VRRGLGARIGIATADDTYVGRTLGIWNSRGHGLLFWFVVTLIILVPVNPFPSTGRLTKAIERNQVFCDLDASLGLPSAFKSLCVWTIERLNEPGSLGEHIFRD
jgi:hypothetical protein